MLNFPRQTIVGLTLSYRHGIVRRTARLTFPSHVDFSEHPRGFKPVVDGHFRRASMSGKADGGASGITLISSEEPTHWTCGLRRAFASAVLGARPARGPPQRLVRRGTVSAWLGMAHQGDEVRQSAAVGSGASARTPKHDIAKIAHALANILDVPGHGAAQRLACGPRTARPTERFCRGAFPNARARRSRGDAGCQPGWCRSHDLGSLAPRAARPSLRWRKGAACIARCRERRHIGRATGDARQVGEERVASGMTAANPVPGAHALRSTRVLRQVLT